MKVKCTKTFTSYAAADSWIEANGYSESIVDIKDGGVTVVTLEGPHAVRAIEADAKAKVVVLEARP
jgi:hypothetical protein